MPKGYTGVILKVDLTEEKIEKINMPESFYRLYLGGSAFGGYFLLKETSGNIDAFDESNVLTVAPGVTTGAAVSGVSRCCVIAISPETGAVGDSQLGGSIGPMIKRAGYDAIVITGKASKPSYLFVNNDEVQIKDADALWGKTILEAHDALTEKHGSSKVSILQCGPAGGRLVRFASLMGDFNNAAGRTGMGAVFGSKNLRAIVAKGEKKPEFADPDGLKNLAQLGAGRIEGSGFPETLKKYGTPGVLGFQAEAGNLCARNYSQSYHPDYKKLDGATFEPEIGSGQTTCYACAVSCRKKVKVESPHKVTDRLGGPEFETLGCLGSNLEIMDPIVVSKANELCNNYGLDTITMGGLAAYLFESVDSGLIGRDQVDGRKIGFGDSQGLLWLIEQVAGRKGVGDVIADGFEACIKHFGQETRKYAINVKGHGLAVHMAQVKPSQALIYAVCPIGADHMSAEHDWLLASDSEACKGLGIFNCNENNSENGTDIRSAAESTGLSKVRMTVYGQFYYSLLDTLCLCMFCWGPGNLYTYKDLEDLVKQTTGWDCSFWELMKAGERRINMLRVINARRGFTRKDDILPKRLSEPLPDGPAEGKCVNPDDLERMTNQYYALMGWDIESGNPSEGKLMELGLEWSI